MKANDFYIGIVLLFSVMLPAIVITILMLRAGWFEPFVDGLVLDDRAIRFGASLKVRHGSNALAMPAGDA